ncbi:MAG: NAD(P)H-quinone oxidoreductase subunit 2, partial [Leptolyngbya sp. ERB_1_2]
MDFASLVAQLNAGTILPEVIVITTLLIVMVGDLIVGRQNSSKWTPYFAIGGLLTAVGSLFTLWDNPTPIGFLGEFNSDALSIVLRGIVALS